VQRLSQGPVQKCRHAAECKPVEVEGRLEQDQPGQGQGPGQSVEWPDPQQGPPNEDGVAAAQYQLVTAWQ
jgi:hypothetical protein